ncbi:MAG: hypothetical protein OEW94_01725, partial [Betaproteobacteria bacterium]|nr:hypothetical protein [Betaproteobacteria bacterium]
MPKAAAAIRRAHVEPLHFRRTVFQPAQRGATGRRSVLVREQQQAPRRSVFPRQFSQFALEAR